MANTIKQAVIDIDDDIRKEVEEVYSDLNKGLATLHLPPRTVASQQLGPTLHPPDDLADKAAVSDNLTSYAEIWRKQAHTNLVQIRRSFGTISRSIATLVRASASKLKALALHLKLLAYAFGQASLRYLLAVDYSSYARWAGDTLDAIAVLYCAVAPTWRSTTELIDSLLGSLIKSRWHNYTRLFTRIIASVFLWAMHVAVFYGAPWVIYRYVAQPVSQKLRAVGQRRGVDSIHKPLGQESPLAMVLWNGNAQDA